MDYMETTIEMEHDAPVIMMDHDRVIAQAEAVYEEGAEAEDSAAEAVERSQQQTAARTDDSFSAYLNELRKTPLLKAAEELRLARLAKQGDADARRRILQANLRLVVNIARKFANRGLDMEDLVEEGNIGLMHALDKYEPEKGFRFTTYATYWVRQAISRAVMTYGRLIRLPDYLGQEVNTYLRAARSVAGEKSGGAARKEIAQALGKSEADVDYLAQFEARPISMDLPMPGDPDQSIGDFIADDNSPDVVEQAHEAEWMGSLKACMESLTDRERQILLGRYGLFGAESLTLDALATQQKISRERVRQIEKAAMQKLLVTLQARGVSAADLF